MSDERDSQFLDDPQFQAALIACLEKLERGESLDRDELAREYPEFAEPLGEFIENRSLLEQVAENLRTNGVRGRHSFDSGDETFDSRTNRDRFSVGDHIRYVGQYEILNEIARGGMGIVYKARQQRLQRVVALKMILAGRFADPGDVQRFRREARLVAQLQHPNIVAVHEVGEHEGHHYFTMDFVEGQNLANQLRDESLSPRRAAEIVRTVAVAVQYAHERGILHRDLKPANVLLDGTGEPHITDFGLAKLMTSDFTGAPTELTASGQVLGTPSYMSPEQAAGKQNLISTASDIFALGAILYACLTGSAPFVADTPINTLMQVLHKEPISPRLLNPRVPKDLETICLKCLQKEPHKRYGTADHLAEDLARFLADRPVQARPIGPTEAAWRWCHRNPLGAVVVVLLLSLAVVGPVVAIRESRLRQQAFQNARVATEALEREAAARRVVQQRLYNSDINVVQRAYEMADAERMRDVLRRHVPKHNEKDERTFEWWYWWQRCHDHNLVLAHPGRVTAVEFSPDGQTVATGCIDGSARLWSAVDGHLIGALKGHARGYVRLAFAPKGSSLVTLADDGIVNVWDADQLKLRRSWQSGDEWSLSLSPDGAKLATGGMKGGVTIWDLASGEKLDFLEMKDVVIISSLAFSPDGARLALAGDRDDGRPPTYHLEVWDLDSRKKTLPPPPPNAAMVVSIAFSPDGQQLVVGESNKHLVFYQTSDYDFRTIESGHSRLVETLSYSPDGNLIASGGGDPVVRLWDPEGKRLQGKLVGHRAGITDLAFSPDGDRLATASSDSTVRLWNVTAPTMDTQVNLEEQLVAIPLAPSRGSVIVASEAGGNALTWTSSYESLSLKLGESAPVRLSKHGWLVAQERLTNRPFPEKDSYQVRLVDFLHSRPVVDLGQSHQKHYVCSFAPDGSVLANISGQTVKLLSLPGGKPLADCQVHEQPVLSLTFSGDGRYLVSSGAEPTIMVWDRGVGRVVAMFSGYTSEASLLALNPNATLLASVHSDNAIRLWNVGSAELVATLTGHADPVHAVEFSPDGRTLASLSRDGLLCLWDPAMHELRSTLQAHSLSNSDQLVWTPDGRTLAVHCIHDKLQIWQAALEAPTAD